MPGHSDADAVYSTLGCRLTTIFESLSERLTSSTMTLLALEKLSGVIKFSVSSLATTTTRHNSALNAINTRLTNHNTTLTTIKTRLENQSNILREITQQNVSQDARVQTVEGDLTSVHGSVNTFDAKLLGLCTTRDTATSILQVDVNDLRARIIPDLRRDLQTDIQHSANATAQVIDYLRRDLQMGIQQLANATAQVIDDAMAHVTDDRRDLLSIHPQWLRLMQMLMTVVRPPTLMVSIRLVIVVSPWPPMV